MIHLAIPIDDDISYTFQMSQRSTSLLSYIFLIVISLQITDLTDVEDAFPHPMLYFNQGDASGLRSKASSTHAKIVTYISDAAREIRQDTDRYLPPDDLKRFAANWNEHFGNNLCMLAMYGVLFPNDDEAFKLTSQYMDRMASYPDWYVESSRGRDQVPIGHSLTGFATAYDFLYRRFSEQQREKYYQVIKKTVVDLYRLFQIGKVEWANQYIHNHAPSNLVAFLLGSLVVSAREENIARPWLLKVQEHLDFALELFSYVIDGSVDEGVSYGSYTSRGLTQYVYLAKRHFKIDHSNNPWLKEHFWFFYHTMLPGYQRTVGIGDTNYHWFYGPESQIHSLDAFVLQSGNGNWLADMIRSSRSKTKPLAQSTAQIWSTFHTEFLFYNSSLQSTKPERVSKMQIFSDWGVVTYGGGQEMGIGKTFLSFKSSVPNGEAVQDIIDSKRYPGRINGWKNFNAGHEHPDQNSFVFAPNGRYVVSESMYGPKMSHLDNTVVFAPSSTSRCNQPWEGQVGECDKWLAYKLYGKDIRGEILSAQMSGEMAFAAGEAVGAYSKSLKLSSVFRATLLLTPEVLIVVDAIRRFEGSETSKASFLFHNTWTKYKAHEDLGFKGAKVDYPEGSYTMLTVPHKHGTTNISLHEGVQPAGLREGPTNFVNVTVPLLNDVTNAVHIFSGPNYKIQSLEIEPMSPISGVSLLAKINNESYSVKISTLAKSHSRLLEPIRERKRVTGFGGFAKVTVHNKSGEYVHYFGLDNDSYNAGHGPEPRQYRMKLDVTSDIPEGVPQKIPYTSSFPSRVEPLQALKKSDAIEQTAAVNHIVLRKPNRDGAYLIAQCAMFVTVSLLAVVFRRFVTPKSKFNSLFRNASWHVPCCLFVSAAFLNSYCLDGEGRNVCFLSKRNSGLAIDVNTSSVTVHPVHSTDSESNPTVSIPNDPFVMLTSLPGSGGFLLEKMFEGSSLTTYLPTEILNIPSSIGDTRDLDLCVWSSESNHFRLETAGWFNSLKTKRLLHFNQQCKTGGFENIQRVLRQNHNAPIVMNDVRGFWTTKLPWIKSVIGKGDFQAAVVVRDPRSWIYTMLKYHSGEGIDAELDDITDHVDKLQAACKASDSNLPYYHAYLQAQRPRLRRVDNVEKLAMIWTMAVGSVLANMADDYQGSLPVHIIRFEDIMTEPERATTDMFAKLGLPLPVKSLNKVIRTVKSGRYESQYDGDINADILTAWRTGLSSVDIRKIETICGGLFGILEYEFV